MTKPNFFNTLGEEVPFQNFIYRHKRRSLLCKLSKKKRFQYLVNIYIICITFIKLIESIIYIYIDLVVLVLRCTLTTCLSLCLFACLSVCLFAYLSVCVLIWYIYLHVSVLLQSHQLFKNELQCPASPG